MVNSLGHLLMLARRLKPVDPYLSLASNLSIDLVAFFTSMVGWIMLGLDMRDIFLGDTLLAVSKRCWRELVSWMLFLGLLMWNRLYPF